MIVVSDTSPLSSLAIVGYISLLPEIYNTVIIPEAVANELANTSDEDERVTAVLSLDWIEIRQATDQEVVTRLQNEQRLDLGESEAIALALELNADELLIDERLGRREATKLGVPITGLLGILLVAKHRGLIPIVKPVIDDLMTEAGFRVSIQLYTEILNAAGEY
ncbi:MAG: DUF3368 domain-containing protein [Nostoc sp. NOS(2021)]|uniref:DUF3368 domain-containing protein n=1 Tax=Nostoc sp. NOS(2021) TaxID=2815407 RepID=UPI0025E1C872|nr:DUF3368 domain-containing protein [Nostoc sp. NOS(2021)]MBN3896321.1 DUF3368 domain-containing protein [Nostoc sp. NOS(2021)]